jgi:hypothetical protein
MQAPGLQSARNCSGLYLASCRFRCLGLLFSIPFSDESVFSAKALALQDPASQMLQARALVERWLIWNSFHVDAHFFSIDLSCQSVGTRLIINPFYLLLC